MSPLPTMLRLALGLALAPATALAQDVCDFPIGSVQWGLGGDPCAVTPGSFSCSGAGDGVCDSGDAFRAEGTGAAASHIRLVDDIALDGPRSMLCVAGESSLTVDVQSEGHPLRLGLPGGAFGLSCGGLRTTEGSSLLLGGDADLTLHGAYLAADGVSLRGAPEVVAAGRIVPCAGDCATTAYLERLEWDCLEPASCAAPAPPTLPAFLAAAEAQRAQGATLLCFWDADPSTLAGPRDQGHCYTIVSVSSEPPYSLDIDLRQRPPSGAFAGSDGDDAPDHWRVPGATLLQASLQPGDRDIRVADGFVSVAHTLAGKFVRLSRGGSFEQRSYAIQNSELGHCSSRPDLACSFDMQCQALAPGDVCDPTAPDRLRLLDVRGVAAAHAAEDPNEAVLVIDPGHRQGDTFFVLVPVEVTAGSAAPPHWLIDDQELMAIGTTAGSILSLEGLLWHSLGQFRAHRGTIAAWRHNLFWAVEGGNAVILGSLFGLAVPDKQFGHTEIVAGLSARDESGWCVGPSDPHPCCSGPGVGSCLGASHGVLMCSDPEWTFTDWKLRYRGDDMVNYCSGNTGVDASLNVLKRLDARWMVPAVDVGASGNFVAHSGGGSGPESFAAHSIVTDGICVSCVSGDAAGGVHSATSGAAPWTSTRYENVALIANYGGVGAGGRDVFRNMLVAGMRALEAPPGWPFRRGSWSVLDGGTWQGVVARENFAQAGTLIGPNGPTLSVRCGNLANGTASGDLCATDADCGVAGETCAVRLNAGHFYDVWARHNVYGAVRGIDVGRGLTAGTTDLLGACPFGMGTGCTATLDNAIIADNFCLGCEHELADSGATCNAGAWTTRNVTFAYTVDGAGAPLDTPTHEGFLKVGGDARCLYNHLDGLLFYGARNQPRQNHASHLAPAAFDCTGASVGSTLDACPTPPGAAFCYENNDQDTANLMDPSQNVSYVQGLPLGLVDPPTGRHWTSFGSVAHSFDCGARRGARAPGVCGELWYHHVLGIAPECAWDRLPVDTDGDGIFDDGDGSGVAGDRPCTSGAANAPCDDNCRFEPNPDQTDGGGVVFTTPDGIGNACQCGDPTGSGVINAADVGAYNKWIASGGLIPSPFDVRRCDVGGDATCNLADVGRLNLAIAMHDGDTLRQNCPAARPAALPNE